MTPRQLGDTGLLVSPIGLGLAALGRPAYVTLGRAADFGANRSVEALEARCHLMLDSAYASGVRYVDAARSYGLAEAFLASWLKARQLPAAAITIGSKWGYDYTGAWNLAAAVHEEKDLSIARLRRQWAETHSVLGDAVDLYQIHSATLESGVLDDTAVIGELARLRAAGVIVGLTVTGTGQAMTIRRAIAIAVDGVPLFQSVQATWNLLETSAGTALADAHDRGVGVIVKEVLANGRLTDEHGGPEVQPLREEATRRGATIDGLAFAIALAQPWVDVVLSGAVTVGQLRSNLRATEADASLAPIGASGADQSPLVAERPDEYWNRRRALVWN